MPQISVVVPIYNVELFLEECLASVERQTVRDFEVIMVDDGSTDDSAAIAESFARRDERFRLLTQPNGGLSRARNTGTDAAVGRYLAFLDSDDVLPRNSYELLLTALEKTGSDFATGNVHRLTRFGRSQSPFLSRAFAETRMRTHVTKYRPLIADRTVWNKLWRRSFWDRNGFRFPEGRLNEDIPITVPAHFLASSVDVIADPVYFWRIREGGDLSITQRRLEQRALLDRLQAIQDVSDHLDRHGPRRARRWYRQSVVADDLRYYLNALEGADDAYLELFLDRVNAYLDNAGDRIFDPLPAIERLKWHLVRRRLVPELMEVLRFEKQDMAATPPVRVRGRWYGDYPFRTDRRLNIPASMYRLKGELALRASLETLERDGGAIRIAGHAYVTGIGAPEKGSQKVEVSVLRSGRLRRVRLMTSAIRLSTRSTHRPEATAGAPQGLGSDVSWSGFDAVLDPRPLRRRRRRGEGIWDLYVTVRTAGVRRRRSRFVLRGGRPLHAVRVEGGEFDVTAAVSAEGYATMAVSRQSATLTGHQLVEEGVVELLGSLRLRPEGDKPALEARRESDGRRLRFRLRASGSSFSARVPLDDLHGAGMPLDADDELSAWALHVVEQGRRTPLALGDGVAEAHWRRGGREVALAAGRSGATLLEGEPRPLLTGARLRDDGTVELTGEGALAAELVLEHAERGVRHRFALSRGDAGAFTALVTPVAVPTLSGPISLAEGIWELRAPAPLAVAGELADRLPLRAVVGHKGFALAMTDDRRAVLTVERDLNDDERGPFHQRRLRATAYAARRAAPLRDAVVYNSFLGRQYSDSPRAIHEELVRRDAPFEHLWVVRDGACTVPGTATVLREGSHEYHEALATSRYIVTNDHFPDWFMRRDDQLCLQTWHGTPLKRLGFDVSDMRRTVRRFQRRWEQQVANWQYVLSPNRFSTPLLRRAYAIEGEMLETGYPRVDILARPDRDEAGRELRARLGIPEGVRTVLYAPTYRDQVTDRRGRYRLDLRLDLERLRRAVGPDTVILFRKHHYVVDSPPATADGFVLDVSDYGDGTELLLAADVLITDYSSMMVDFANTGRPMLFYTYDLDAYADEIRGFYLDFVDTVPGPLLRTTDEVAEALRDLNAVRSSYAERYSAFQARFCELDDGRASERVVDRLLSW